MVAVVALSAGATTAVFKKQITAPIYLLTSFALMKDQLLLNLKRKML